MCCPSKYSNIFKCPSSKCSRMGGSGPISTTDICCANKPHSKLLAPQTRVKQHAPSKQTAKYNRPHNQGQTSKHRKIFYIFILFTWIWLPAFWNKIKHSLYVMAENSHINLCLNECYEKGNKISGLRSWVKIHPCSQRTLPVVHNGWIFTHISGSWTWEPTWWQIGP